MFFGALLFMSTVDKTLFPSWSDWPWKLKGSVRAVKSAVKSVGMPDIEKGDIAKKE
jgi:hypothetical protein